MKHNQAETYLRRVSLPRRHLGWALCTLVLGWGVVSLVLSDWGLVDLWELEAKETHLRAELQDLKEQAEEVDWELSEPGGMEIERPAREKFEMQRPGEIVYHFAAPKENQTNVESESLTSSK